MSELNKLHAKWQTESDKSIADIVAVGGHPSTVTKESMRLLVLEWHLEIKAAENADRFTAAGRF